MAKKVKPWDQVAAEVEAATGHRGLMRDYTTGRRPGKPRPIVVRAAFETLLAENAALRAKLEAAARVLSL